MRTSHLKRSDYRTSEKTGDGFNTVKTKTKGAILRLSLYEQKGESLEIRNL